MDSFKVFLKIYFAPPEYNNNVKFYISDISDFALWRRQQLHCRQALEGVSGPAHCRLSLLNAACSCIFVVFCLSHLSQGTALLWIFLKILFKMPKCPSLNVRCLSNLARRQISINAPKRQLLLRMKGSRSVLQITP